MNTNRFVQKLLNFSRRKRLYDHDHVLLQERFEPASWSKSLDTQLASIKKLLRNAKMDKDYYNSKKKVRVPRGYTRVIVPKLSYLAKMYKVEDPYTEIGVLVDQVCELLIVNRDGNFTHYRKGQLGPDRIQCIQEMTFPRINLELNVPGDLLVLDVDMGNHYAGWTPRRAREDISFREDIMALSGVDLCWIVLTNPNRFQRNVDLSVDSVFEEYLSTDRGWVTNLFMYHRGGKLEFGYRWNRRAYFDCGAAIAKIN